MEETPIEFESDEIIASPTPDILQIWHTASTPLGPSDLGEETRPKVPYYSISAGGAENIDTDRGNALDLHIPDTKKITIFQKILLAEVFTLRDLSCILYFPVCFVYRSWPGGTLLC